MHPTRRDFTKQALRSLTAVALLEGLHAHRLFGDDVRPIVDEWFGELDAITRDLKEGELRDLEFQRALEGLYRRVDLPALLHTLEFDRLSEGINFRERGETSLPVSFRNVDGLPRRLVFGRQIFALKKGRSVIPHGHDNMATGFLVLKGNLRGRHWDRLEDHDDHYIIEPTIDRAFGAGEFSTVSDRKDNVHWFTGEGDASFIFNIHVLDVDPDHPRRTGRVYVDPLGERLSGGRIRAPKISAREARERYG